MWWKTALKVAVIVLVAAVEVIGAVEKAKRI
jgi:hypothetical protein